MPGRTAKVIITDRQQDILQTIRNAPTASSQLRQRAAIILLAFAKQGNVEIATEVGLSRPQVSLWRRRWAKAWDRLIRIECTQSHAALRRAIEQVLGDEPRSGPPGKFTPEQIVAILAVAASPPRSPDGRSLTGRPRSWPTRSFNAASCRRSRSPRWVATSARPPCNRTRSGIGSTPARKTRWSLRSGSRRSVTPTRRPPRWRRTTGRTRSAPMR
jgi:hypothetical protein